MNKLAKALVIAGVAVLGVVANGRAQVQQPINFNLKLYDSSGGGVHIIKITTKDVIENLLGDTNVAGAKLWLIMPNDIAPAGDNGNIGASLRVTDSQGNIIVETTSDTFNIYQTSYTGRHQNLCVEPVLAGFRRVGSRAVWNGNLDQKQNKTPGGQGSFRVAVSGTCSLGGTSNGQVPCTGSIVGGAAKPAS